MESPPRKALVWHWGAIGQQVQFYPCYEQELPFFSGSKIDNLLNLTGSDC